VGRRFEGHEIPLEMLRDLAVLQELIIQVAKEEFLRDNSNRQRSPRGFTDGVTLSLSAVEAGSSIPVITLTILGASAGLFPPEIETYMVRGRDRVIAAIEAADRGGSPAEHISEKSLMYFDRLGRSLKSGEAIEFSSEKMETRARLTLESRRSLLLSVASTKEYTEEVVLRGLVPEMNQEESTFELGLPDGATLKAPVPPEHYDTILGAFNGWRKGEKVIINGVAKRDRTGKLMSVVLVESVNVVQALDVVERLSELKELRDGWLDGSGTQLDSAGLDWLSSELDNGYPGSLPLPRIYPTEKGNVHLEWLVASWDISLDVDLGTKQSLWHSLNLETDEEEEATFGLDAKEGWNALFEKLAERGVL
jgi:hypothetical protein